jgi:hypothetical protein
MQLLKTRVIEKSAATSAKMQWKGRLSQRQAIRSPREPMIIQTALGLAFTILCGFDISYLGSTLITSKTSCHRTEH